VDEDVAVSRLLPERLWRLQRATGVSVTFGGPTRPSPGGRQIVLTRLTGTLGESLRGLTVDTGRGLGGVVLRDKAAHRVRDYASTSTITHEFDGIVVGQERITSMLAMPVTVGGTVRAVLYGAVRESSPIGDRAVSAACAVAEQMARDVARQQAAGKAGETGPLPEAAALPGTALLDPAPHDPALLNARAALTELATLIGDVPDPLLRARMARLCQALGGDCEPPATIALAPRERDVLRIAAVGATNVEIAAQLGLSPQTVKAYMRAAMRKLGVHNRTAALHAARLAAAI
jgi:LuxR family transcriptional regulator, regulator of acetate metabolism